MFRVGFEGAFAGGQVMAEMDFDELYETITASLSSSVNICIPVIMSAVSAVLILYLILRKEWSAESFWDIKKVRPSYFLLCFALGAALNFFVSGALTFLPVPDGAQPFDFLLGDNFFLMFLSIAVIAPVTEEIIFRGIIQKRLMKMIGIPGAVILQAVIFGVFHLNLLQGAYSFFLGLIIGTVYYFYGSVWIPIALHISFNGTSAIISHIAGDAGTDSFFLLAVTAAGFLISVWSMIELLKRSPAGVRVTNSGRWE